MTPWCSGADPTLTSCGTASVATPKCRRGCVQYWGDVLPDSLHVRELDAGGAPDTTVWQSVRLAMWPGVALTLVVYCLPEHGRRRAVAIASTEMFNVVLIATSTWRRLMFDVKHQASQTAQKCTSPAGGNTATGARSGDRGTGSQVAGVAGTTLACDNAPIMPGRLADKVAIVTGGNSGMGAGTVELFVAEGARVVIAARGEELGQAVADRLGDNALFVRADVSVEADVKAMVDATMAKWGRVDVLFNNAGIGQGFVPPEDFALDDFNRVMTTNLGSCFLGLKYVTAIMKEQGGGSIINNGSTAGVTTDGSGPVYSASKAAVIHITKVWATQLAEFGIRVNCISPGAIVTPIFWGGYQTQSVEENERREQRLTEHFANALPLNRAGTPEDIAYAALYLASDESRHTTGHNLMVDAGITARMAAQAGLVEGFDAIRRSVSPVS